MYYEKRFIENSGVHALSASGDRLQRKERGGDFVTLDEIGITAPEVGTDAVTLHFAPSDDRVAYYPALLEKAAFEQFASDEAYIRSVLDGFISKADQTGKRLDEIIAEETCKGPQTKPFANLTPHTNYIACAFGIDPQGRAASGLFRKTVTTAEPVKLEDIVITFPELTKYEVLVEFAPSTDLKPYYATIIDKAYFDQLGSDEKNIADDLEYLAELAEKEQTDLPTTIAKYTYTGTQRLPFNGLKSSTDYVAYAFGLETDGTVTSILFKEPFRTPAPAQSDNLITLDITKLGIDGAVVSATTTNDDPYILDVWEMSKLTGMSDEQIIDMVLASYAGFNIDTQIAMHGDDTLDVMGEIAPTETGTDCIALAFGYEAGVVTTGLVKEEFRTKPGDWVETTFTIRQDALTSRSATFTVTAHTPAGEPDETTPFFFTQIPTEKLTQIGDTDEALGQYLTNTIKEEAEYMGYPLDTYIRLILFRGEKTETYSELTPGSELTIIAAGVNTNAKVITQVARSEKITVPAPSAATVTFGTPVIEGYKVTVSVQAGAGTPKWRAAGMGSTAAYMSDDAIIAHLLGDFVGDSKPEISYTILSDYESEAYFFAIGLDATGNPGNLVRLVVPVSN